MTDTQRDTQLANIEAATGRTVAEFTEDVRRTGLDRHGRIVSYLKDEHGLTHGNANLLAHVVREQLRRAAHVLAVLRVLDEALD